jgi:hypothetical protein
MKPVFPKALLLALLLAVTPFVSNAAPTDPGAWQSWQSSVVATNVVMFINGTLTVNDFPVDSANSLIGVFVPTLPNQAVGAYALAGGSGSFSIAVYGNTGETTQNGAISGEHLDFYYHDNVTGRTTAAVDPAIVYSGSDPASVFENVSLRVYFPPSITAFEPSGAVGARVLLTGTNFSALPSGNEVTFNGVPATVDNVLDGTRLLVTVPGGAQSGKIRIQTAGGNTMTFGDFTVIPRITGFTPSSGIRGDVVTVDGNNFGSAPTFSIGGTPLASSAVTVVNDNQASFTISDDVISGAVSVTTSQGTGSSASTLTVFPTVTGISPLTGGIGDVLTISGTGFDNSSAGATVVTFTGGDAAELVSVTRTSLGARVPGGALDGPITVSTSAGPATSADSFSITTRHFADPVPTPFSMALSGSVKKNGTAARAGDEIAAWSVHRKLPLIPMKWEKRLVGHATILEDGTLSAMPVYGDNPATIDNVEGCTAGEEVLLVLWSASEQKSYYATRNGATGAPASALLWDNTAVPSPLDVDFIEGQRIPLIPGRWNMVSFGVLRGYLLSIGVPPTNRLTGATYDNVSGTRMTEAFPLKSIDGLYDRVMGSDGLTGTKVLNPSDNVSGLRVLSPGYGYYVKVAPSTRPLVWMTFPGPLAAGNEQLQLTGSGRWTLLGYWGNERIYHNSLIDPSVQLSPLSATENALVSSIGDVWSSLGTNYDLTMMVDGSGTKTWKRVDGTGFFRYLAPGYGYYIKMNSPAMLSYPDGTH